MDLFEEPAGFQDAVRGGLGRAHACVEAISRFDFAPAASSHRGLGRAAKDVILRVRHSCDTRVLCSDGSPVTRQIRQRVAPEDRAGRAQERAQFKFGTHAKVRPVS